MEVLATLPPLRKASLLERPNRFTLRLSVNDAEILAYLPNSGRLPFLKKGTPVYVSEDRKTKYGFRAIIALDGKTYVHLPAQEVNDFFEKALSLLPAFRQYSSVRREVPLKSTRIDFLLDDQAYVEVKSCTLVENGIAKFPDSPTERGKRHLKALLEASSEKRCYVVFVIQRNDAKAFQPNASADPEFARLMGEGCGLLEYVAFTVVPDVRRKRVYFGQEIPVLCP